MSAALRVRRHDVDVAVLREAEGDVPLHPEVDRDDAASAVGVDRRDRVADRRGDGADEVDPVRAGLGPSGGEQFVVRGGPECAGNGAVVADQAGEPTGVDPRDARNTLLVQHRTEVGLRTEVAVSSGEVAHDDAPTERADRLEVGRR